MVRGFRPLLHYPDTQLFLIGHIAGFIRVEEQVLVGVVVLKPPDILPHHGVVAPDRRAQAGYKPVIGVREDAVLFVGEQADRDFGGIGLAAQHAVHRVFPGTDAVLVGLLEHELVRGVRIQQFFGAVGEPFVGHLRLRDQILRDSEHRRARRKRPSADTVICLPEDVLAVVRLFLAGRRFGVRHQLRGTQRVPVLYELVRHGGERGVVIQPGQGRLIIFRVKP